MSRKYQRLTKRTPARRTKVTAKIGKMKKKFSWSKITYRDEDDNYYYAYYGKEELGHIEYYKKWKKWVWFQGDDIIMSIECLNEVVKKLKELEEEGK